MDERVRLSLNQRLRAALAASLPLEQHDHPDARHLFDLTTPAGVDESALRPLVDALALSTVEQVALALAVAVELDARLAAALALLQGQAARPGPNRPTLGLVVALSARLEIDAEPAPAAALAFATLLDGSALASGLLQWGDAQQLAHARTLNVAPALIGVLAQRVPPRHRLPMGRLQLAPLAAPGWPLPQAWRLASKRLAASTAAAGGPSVIVLRGADRGELGALAADLARRLGRVALAIEGADDPAAIAGETLAAHAAREGVVPALIACHALPVWHADVAPGRPMPVPELAHWSGPLVVLGGSDSAFETSLPLHEFELSLPDAADRRELWSALRQADGRAGDAADDRAIAASRCGMAVLAQAAARSEPGESAQAAIEQAVRSSARSLSAWAQVSRDRIPADAWVGPAHVHRELGLLLTRCLARAEASTALGPLLNGRLGDGVKALFIGASGTGKTLAAQWLADRLARPLVRVDLAAVVSKYIGETEKNLAQLLARAEHLDAVLLFDEADSLFGARTDVKQANDRYANMQTNYLLQRLETFHGVALLTSNSKARFDDAFLRRLDAVVEFPLPDVAERRALWSLHLGSAPGVEAGFLNAVAALVDLPGGHIRNAVLTAALLARQRGAGLGDESESAPPMNAADLREALTLEYRKLGQRAPDSLG